MVQPLKDKDVKIRKEWNIKPATKRKNSLRKSVNTRQVREEIKEAIDERKRVK